MRQQQNKLDGQARQALGAGREDLAREALGRKATLQTQISDLENQYQSLQADEEKLTVASQRLQAKVEAFRMQKETIKATYTAAEAQSRIGEAVSGISEEMGDVGMAVQRAQDKTAQMQARAGAIDELMASGALEDMTGTPRDDIQAELDAMRTGPDIELELQRLKGEISGGPTPQIEGGAGTARRPATVRATLPRSSPRPVREHDRPDPGRGPAPRWRSRRRPNSTSLTPRSRRP